MRLSLPATTDYWVNDKAGDPLFVVTAEVNAGLVAMLPKLLAQVRQLVGKRRVTVIFDRGGWSPKLFARLLKTGFDILTYRKGHWKGDSIVRYNNRFLLLADGHGLRPRTKVVVQDRLDGTLRIARNGRYFEFKQVQARPYMPEQLRRAKPRPPIGVTWPRLPRNPFFGDIRIGNGRPMNVPAATVLS